jgi:hypothetical protein
VAGWRLVLLHNDIMSSIIAHISSAAHGNQVTNKFESTAADFRFKLDGVGAGRESYTTVLRR